MPCLEGCPDVELTSEGCGFARREVAVSAVPSAASLFPEIRDRSALASPRPMSDDLVPVPSYADLIRGRAFTIAVANAVLFVVAWAGTRWTYESATAKAVNIDLVYFAIVIVLGLFLGTDNPGNRLFAGLNVQPLRQEKLSSENRRSIVLVVVYFLSLLLLILLDFYAAGRLVNATGGLVTSPYAQIPLIMIVLGAVMANSTPFRIGLVIVGFAYFVACQYTTIFGDIVHSPHLIDANRLPVLLLAVTLMNLSISVGIQILRPRDPVAIAARTVGTAPQDDGDHDAGAVLKDDGVEEKTDNDE